ncbi:MAG: hypothetical protein ACI4PR_00090 [Acutalibacteraceae bacterium]
MNKKLLAGLMSVVILAGSGGSVGAYYTPAQAWSATKSFVKQHKKIVGSSIAGAALLLGAFCFRKEIKSRATSEDHKGGILKEKPVSKTNSKSGTRVKILSFKPINSKDAIYQPETQEGKRAEAKKGDAPVNETESVKSATESETSSELAEKVEDTTKISENVEQSIIETRVNEEENKSEQSKVDVSEEINALTIRSEVSGEKQLIYNKIHEICESIDKKYGHADYLLSVKFGPRSSLVEKRKKESIMQAKLNIDKLYAELYDLVVATGKMPNEVIQIMKEFEEGTLRVIDLRNLSDEWLINGKYSLARKVVLSLECKALLENGVIEMEESERLARGERTPRYEEYNDTFYLGTL